MDGTVLGLRLEGSEEDLEARSVLGGECLWLGPKAIQRRNGQAPRRVSPSEWDVLLFPRVDRETRFLAGSYDALSQLLKAELPIYFAKHHLLLRQGDSEAFDKYLELVRDARTYIKILKANTEGGRVQAMEAGRIPSGWGPKGLTGYDWNNGRFVKNGAAPAVETMLRLYLQGYSESGIMRELKRRRVLTVAGKPYAQSTVSKVLHHARWYAGTIRVRR
jgi:hypothetical protein